MEAHSNTSEARLERLRRQRRHPMRRLIAANLRDIYRLLQEAWLPLLGFFLVMAAGALYLVLLYDDRGEACLDLHGPCHRFIPALYETLQLLVLESSFPLPEDALGRALFFTIPLLGLALIFQSVMDFGRLLLDKGSRREAWQLSLASTFRDHVIVCGLGRVSYRVMLQLLETGYEVVVVESDWSSEFVQPALTLKVPVVLGDAREIYILQQAGVARARGIVAGTNNDLLNIEIALAARRKRPDIQVVLRIFNDELDTNLERSFGHNTAFSSSALAAATLSAAAVSRDIIHVLPLLEVNHNGLPLLGISEITIIADSELSGFVQSIEDQFDVRVLRYIDTSGRERPPRLMRRIEGGDRVLLLGSLEALEQARLCNQRSKLGFLSPVPPQRPTARLNTVIICGLGKVGYRVVKDLQRMHPRPEIVVIYGEGTKSPFLEEVQALGIRTIAGDATNPELLRMAEIERAYSIAAVTSDSLVNLQIGLAARRLRSDVHLVLRVFSDVLAEQLEELFSTRTVFSTSALAAPTLAAAAVVRGIDHAIDIGERLLSTVSLTVQPSDEFAGRMIRQVREQTEVLVIALRRNGAPVLPLKLETCLDAGDEIVVLVDIAMLSRLRSRSLQTGEATTRHLVATRTQRLDRL